MATIRNLGSTFTLSSSGDWSVGNASDEGQAGGMLIQIVNGGSLSATITVKAQNSRVFRESAADSFLPVPYRSINVNGSVGTGGYVTTALTTNSIIFVPAGAQEVVLSCSYTSGTATVYVTPVIGSCGY